MSFELAHLSDKATASKGSTNVKPSHRQDNNSTEYSNKSVHYSQQTASSHTVPRLVHSNEAKFNFAKIRIHPKLKVYNGQANSHVMLSNLPDIKQVIHSSRSIDIITLLKDNSLFGSYYKYTKSRIWQDDISDLRAHGYSKMERAAQSNNTPLQTLEEDIVSDRVLLTTMRERNSSAPRRTVLRPSISGINYAIPHPANPHPTIIDDEDSTGSDAIPQSEIIHIQTQSPSLDEQYNDEGFLDGEQESHLTPKIFVNRGITGRDVVHWAGGRGGTGNQAVGHITLRAPVIEGRDPPRPGERAESWVRPGTGTARVTRSFTGVLIGANGPNWFITPRAAARIDIHERLHIRSSRNIHNRNIVPLEQRIAQHMGEPSKHRAGNTRAEARNALRTFIRWNRTIRNFRNQDTAANTPGGTVDAADQASPNFIRDLGPRVVRGRRFAHFVDQ